MLPTHTGVYEDGDDGLYAEVHMDSNPQYIAMAVESPAVPYGYHGYWILTSENPPQWKFFGGRSLQDDFHEDHGLSPAIDRVKTRR